MSAKYANAAQAYMAIRQCGAEPDLIDHLTMAKRAWRNPDRDWAYRNAVSGPTEVCSSYAALIEDESGFTEMQAELGDFWPARARQEIIAFAESLSLSSPATQTNTAPKRGRLAV